MMVAAEVDGHFRRFRLVAVLAEDSGQAPGQFVQALAHHAFFLFQGQHGLPGQITVHGQLLAGLVQQFLLGQEDVAVVRGLLQHIEQPGLDAQGVILGKAQLAGRGVGRHEADAPDVHGQAVGVLAHHVEGLAAVGAVDAHGIGGRDAVGLQKEQQIADAPVLGPAFLDLLETLLAHALDLEQAFGLFVQHADGVRAEGGHDASGHLLAHALDEAGGQIQPYAFAGGGQHLLGHVEGQLAAEARVVDPAAADLQLDAHLRVDHVAHAGHGIAAHRAAGRALDLGLHGQGSVGQQAQHGITVLFVVEDHTLQRAGEFHGIGIAQQGKIVGHGGPDERFLGGWGSSRGKGDLFTAGKRAPFPLARLS